MTHNGGLISWQTIVRACIRERARPIRATKLTIRHVVLNARSIMNCPLANSIYTKPLISDIRDQDDEISDADRDATVWYMESMYIIKRIFSSRRPIRDENHSDLEDLIRIANEFEDWENQAESGDHLPTAETLQDIKTCLRSFVAYAKYVPNG